MKCCTICNLEKEESLFTKNRNQCKECRKNRRIQRYKDNIEFYREKRKKTMKIIKSLKKRREESIIKIIRKKKKNIKETGGRKIPNH